MTIRRVDWNDLDFDEHHRAFLDGVPFTGVAVEMYPSGALWTESPMVDGLIEGSSREWYEDGQIESDEVHHRGALRYVRTWHRNGQLKEEATVEDTIALTRKVWDEHGRLLLDYTLPDDPEDANRRVLELWRDIVARREAGPPP